MFNSVFKLLFFFFLLNIFSKPYDVNVAPKRLEKGDFLVFFTSLLEEREIRDGNMPNPIGKNKSIWLGSGRRNLFSLLTMDIDQKEKWSLRLIDI